MSDFITTKKVRGIIYNEFKKLYKQVKLSIYLVIFIVVTVNINIIADLRLEKVLNSLIYIDTMILTVCIAFLYIGYRLY
ncbi:hypothetical protein Q5M85_15225 [Paraclostridium bifermentans]|nr:hypothetical protein [Paraclostridium bifermentans]